MGRRSRVEDGRVGMKRDGKHFCLEVRVEVETRGVFVCFPSGLRVANVDDGGFDVDRLMTHGAIDVTPLPNGTTPKFLGRPIFISVYDFGGNDQVGVNQRTSSTTT